MINLLIKHSDLLERARDLGRTNILFIFGIIKAASIGVAVTVFLQLFFDFGPVWEWMRIADQLPKFLLWVVSYQCLLMTFDIAMFATVFLAHIPKKAESFYTFLLVGLETLQFAILSPRVIDKADVTHVMSVEVIVWWYAIFCFYCVSIGLLLFYGRAEIMESLPEFDEDVIPVVRRYIEPFRKILGLVIAAFLISIISFALHLLFSSKSKLGYLVEISSASLLLCMLIGAFFYQHRHRDRIESQLLDLGRKNRVRALENS